jgi:hypothetical protein
MIFALAAGCSGNILRPGSSGDTGGGTGTSGATTGTNGGTTGGMALTSMPAGIRRLTNAEFDHSVADATGLAGNHSASFASDTRQSNFTANIEQRVDATLGDQIRAAAEAIATNVAMNHLSNVVPCDPAAAGCANTFISTFAEKAFRRPATQEEIDALTVVFTTAANGGVFADGVQAVVAAVLQSASFLYIPALGRGTSTALDPYEAASALSYFLTASPPDAMLLDAAKQDKLQTPDEREAHVRRILAGAPAHKQIVKFIKEWLSLDSLYFIDKQASDNFSSLRPSMDGETDAFVEQIIFQGDATIGSLLGADFTMADSTMSSFYGISAGGAGFTMQSLSSTPRRGILSQASFLATHATADASSPVKRGNAVLRKVLCMEIPLPTGDLAARAMMAPPKDPTHTTRERFSTHSTDPLCASCHKMIDPIGFAFEEFDQVGRFRSTENGKPIDSTGTLVGTDVDGPFKDAGELMTMLSKSEQVKKCFATNLFRFASARTSKELEEGFLVEWGKLPADKQPNLLEVIVSFAKSEMFINRTVQ